MSLEGLRKKTVVMRTDQGIVAVLTRQSSTEPCACPFCGKTHYFCGVDGHRPKLCSGEEIAFVTASGQTVRNTDGVVVMTMKDQAE